MMKPTCEELFDEKLKQVFSEADPSWRHGCYLTKVFWRESDNTYWETSYCASTDGETNELREGTAEIFQVEPYQVTKTMYRLVKEASNA